jgi:hypothetical protein
MTRKRILVMGFMANIPIAGVVWQHIHYIVGLQRLGHEVYYIEDSSSLPYDPTTHDVDNDYQYALDKLARLATQFGFEGRWAFCPRYLPGDLCFGLGRSRLLELYRTADAILNICGAQELNADVRQSERIIYVESDPGLEQIRVDKGDEAALGYLSKHRTLFTFGENIGAGSPIPTHQFQWLPTRQPIVTDFWKTEGPPPPGAIFTSVANWNTGGLKDIEWRGEKYLWSKSLEFLKFIEAPERAGEAFELATNLTDPPTRANLCQHGWKLADPDAISIHHDLYRRYLQDSKGEFTPAKDQYVRLETGWFSDRTACYLAAGRPAITQETGFTRHYGGGAGLFAFRTLEEIAEAVRAINGDYGAHCRAAYEIAVEYFEATKVLASLLERAGV